MDEARSAYLDNRWREVNKAIEGLAYVVSGHSRFWLDT